MAHLNTFDCGSHTRSPFLLPSPSCPKFVDDEAQVVHHYEGEVPQKRAHAAFTEDGSIDNSRGTTATLTKLVSQRELAGLAVVRTEAFFIHSWIANHQARKFDECIDKLPVDTIAILIDYSMNYSHEHANAPQSQWWSAYQSTLLPVIVYSKAKDGTVVWARSHVFMSGDLNHSNAAVQHAINIVIGEYEVKFKEEGRELKHVHIWSDGCGGQFKNRNQLYWLTQFTGSVYGLDDDSDGGKGVTRTGRVRVVHHFFQSCHGKGPSDSEGAVIKTALRDAELKHHKYVSQKYMRSAKVVCLAAAMFFPAVYPSLLSVTDQGHCRGRRVFEERGGHHRYHVRRRGGRGPEAAPHHRRAHLLPDCGGCCRPSPAFRERRARHHEPLLLRSRNQHGLEAVHVRAQLLLSGLLRGEPRGVLQ